jgi:hypothetical protein
VLRALWQIDLQDGCGTYACHCRSRVWTSACARERRLRIGAVDRKVRKKVREGFCSKGRKGSRSIPSSSVGPGVAKAGCIAGNLDDGLFSDQAKVRAGVRAVKQKSPKFPVKKQGAAGITVTPITTQRPQDRRPRLLSCRGRFFWVSHSTRRQSLDPSLPISATARLTLAASLTFIAFPSCQPQRQHELRTVDRLFGSAGVPGRVTYRSALV